jgi:hypothetical protein
LRVLACLGRSARGDAGLRGKGYRAAGEMVSGLGGNYRAWGEAIPGFGGNVTGLRGKFAECFTCKSVVSEKTGSFTV